MTDITKMTDLIERARKAAEQAAHEEVIRAWQATPEYKRALAALTVLPEVAQLATAAWGLEVTDFQWSWMEDYEYQEATEVHYWADPIGFPPGYGLQIYANYGAKVVDQKQVYILKGTVSVIDSGGSDINGDAGLLAEFLAEALAE